MKNISFALILAFSSLVSFACTFTQAPEYDVGEDRVSIIQKDFNEVVSVIAVVNLETAQVNAFAENIEVKAQKIQNDSQSYFVAIKSKIENCEYLYISRSIPIPIDSNGFQDLTSIKRNLKGFSRLDGNTSGGLAEIHKV